MKKTVLFVLAILLCFSFVASVVSAFGIFCPYSDNNPLELAPGQSSTVSIALQNMVGDKNITLKAEVTEGSEIARLADETNEYLVPFGGYGSVGVIVTIPAGATIGHQYNVKVVLTTITPNPSGGITIGSSIEKEFPVIVTSGEPVKKSMTPGLILLIVVIVIIAVLIVILFLTKKKKVNKIEIKEKK